MHIVLAASAAHPRGEPDARHGARDVLHRMRIDGGAVAQHVGRLAQNPIGRAEHVGHDAHRHDDIEPGQADRRRDQARQRGQGDEDVDARAGRIRDQNVAAQGATTPPFIPHDEGVQRQRDQDQDQRHGRDGGGLAAAEALEDILQHLPARQQHEAADAERGDRFVLAVAVRVIDVGGIGGGPQAQQADDVGRRIDQRVEGVGQHGDGAGERADEKLDRGDDHVEEQDADEHPAHRALIVFRRQSVAGHGAIIRDWRSGRNRQSSRRRRHASLLGGTWHARSRGTLAPRFSPAATPRSPPGSSRCTRSSPPPRAARRCGRRSAPRSCRAPS